MNTFDSTITRFGPRQQAAIRKVLLRWSREDELGREIVRNVNPLERFLPADDMKPILAVVYGFRSKSITALPDAYQLECFNHTRQGGEVSDPKPTFLGRAVERDAFIGWLYKKYRGYFHTRAFVRDFVRRLLSGDPLTTYESAILTSPYSAWVTWEKSPSPTDPFGFAVDADHLRACLGLAPPRWHGRPAILIVYERNPGLTVHRPTVADAGLHRFFEPPPIGNDEHGLTKTWPSSLRKLSTAPIPRPEAVHAPDTMERLVRHLTRELL